MLIPNITQWLWEFGDGTTSTLKNPVHTYRYMAGKYTVKLTVTDELGNTYTAIEREFIRVYDYDYAVGGNNASISDKCYRFPSTASQGFGPSEYGDCERPGFDWIWPCAGNVAVEKCFDENKQEIILAVDTKTQKVYRINDPDAINDRQGIDDYGVSTRVVAKINQKADYAQQGEHVAIRHTETHAYFDPKDRSKKGTEGYDDVGFRDDSRIDLDLHKDGEPTDYALRTVKLPKDGDIVFQERMEMRTLQHRWKIYGGGWWLKAVKKEYETIDKAAKPSLRKMTETTYQRRLAQYPLFWVSRNLMPKFNLSTGAEASGTVGATVTGPDGREDSAISFLAAPFGLSDTLPESLNGDFTAMIWVKNTFAFPVNLWVIGTMTIRIQTGYVLQFNDGTDNRQVSLSYQGLEWALLTVMRIGAYLDVYENKTFLQRFSLTAIRDYGTACATGTGGASNIFDPRLLPLEISADEIEYYHDQVLKGGEQVLPRY